MTIFGQHDGESINPGTRDDAVDEQEDTVRLSWAVRTDVGKRRPRNEDSAICTGTVFVVADGMGGHAAGDLASAAVVEQFHNEHLTFPVSPEDIYGTLTRASESVARISEAAAREAGTTVTGVALTDVDSVLSWLVFNIGDSRVYAALNGDLVQVTRDHSVVGELVARGEITEEEAETRPDRNQILKAVGFDMDPVPDFWATPVAPGMRILVCSDGLTKEVRDPDISQILATADTAAEAADQLVQAALDNQGSDNVTVIVVDTEGQVPAGAELPDVDETAVSADLVDEADAEAEDTVPRPRD